MKRIVIGSIRPDSGKTSLIVGYGKTIDGKLGYLKPLGDRPVYKKKRIWDTDVSLMTRIFRLQESPELMTLGFDHSKLRFRYEKNGMEQRLDEMAEAAETGKDALLIEAGSQLFSGASLGLDLFSLTLVLQARCYIVVSGTNEDAVDQACYLARDSYLPKSSFGGIIFNKIPDPQEFRAEFLPIVEQTGVRVAGVLPDKPMLRSLTIPFLAENLFLKPLGNEPASDTPVDTIFLGAMSVSEARKHPTFQSGSKLVITSGDRSDLILAAIESGAAGVLVADGISPGADITARANEKKIPLFSSTCDLFELAHQVENLAPLTGPDDQSRLKVLQEMVSQCSEFGNQEESCKTTS